MCKLAVDRSLVLLCYDLHFYGLSTACESTDSLLHVQANIECTKL